MRVYEVDLIHYGLNLTSIMKKSFQRKNEDVFSIDDLKLTSLRLNNTSLENLNLLYFTKVLLYVEMIQLQLEQKYKRRITYAEVRNEFRFRKEMQMKKYFSQNYKEG